MYVTLLISSTVLTRYPTHPTLNDPPSKNSFKNVVGKGKLYGNFQDLRKRKEKNLNISITELFLEHFFHIFCFKVWELEMSTYYYWYKFSKNYIQQKLNPTDSSLMHYSLLKLIRFVASATRSTLYRREITITQLFYIF